ncbi:MAG TPA: SDR family NAD(P)-dependent oxidoreductase, partial [Acinetobacter johnsonii]|nr:SDR family NAD(P)-dependent oxidoreductase [Acinetobacter johnsonii]
MAKILVTGGAGYIGSHTCIQLLSAGHDVVVLDNLSNSSVESLARVQALAAKKLDFVEGDILDQQILDQIFQHHSIDAVIHFAGLKAVGESQKEPLKYFENNISGSISLVKAMERAQV